MAQFSSQLEGLQTNYSRVKDQAAALLQRIGSVTGSGSPSSTGSSAASGEVSSGSGTAGSAGGIGAVQSAVYAGLKFSGLAMRIAQDVVTSVKDDANKILKVGLKEGMLQDAASKCVCMEQVYLHAGNGGGGAANAGEQWCVHGAGV